MMYNNLIYFLVVIFVFSSDSVPDRPWLGPVVPIVLLVFLAVAFYRFAGRIFARVDTGSASSYFRAEKRVTLAALLIYLCFLFTLDLKYYLHPLAFGGRLPILENLAGLTVFFLLLSLMWLQARHAYGQIFQRQHGPWAFVQHNIRANLPIILPWLAISLLFDLLANLPLPGFQEFLHSPWGDLLLFVTFAFLLSLAFPPLIKRLWGCRPLPDSLLLRHMQAFCRSQNFQAEILLWPLFEGQVITAGIMGIFPGLRYLLVTPALLAAMNIEEIEAVLAHEIGHIKKLHLVLYILLFLGFSLLAGALGGLLPFFLLASDWFYRVLEQVQTSPEHLIAVLGALPVLLLMLLYFRYVFGYFIRNFERQADCHVFRAMGTSLPLISSFEKIARLSGNIREDKNWHHFGIGERIRFLERCEEDRTAIDRHDRKVHLSLVCYFFTTAALVTALYQVDTSALAATHEQRFIEAVLEQKLRQEPQNGLWLRLVADLMQEKKMEKRAVDAYHRAQELEPLNAEIKNNLAWLLLTAQDNSLRDKNEALILARAAAALKPQGFILDTLATALWANGLLEEAVRTELEAVRRDLENKPYYLSRITTFRDKEWQGGSGGPAPASPEQ